MRRRAAALVLLVASLATGHGDPAAAQDLGALAAPYLRARDDRTMGEVAGRAYAEPIRPNSPPVPYDSVSVLLLPYSAGLEAQLETVKAHFRDSLRTVAEATAQITAVRAAYERGLLAAGGGELIRGEVSDAKGQLRFREVPAGEWLLFASRETAWHPGKAAKMKRGDASQFLDVPVPAGRSTVTYWWMRLSVRAGESTAVSLNDRNVWLVGVREDMRAPDQPPPGPPAGQPGKRR